MKILVNKKKCLILVVIQLSQNIMMVKTKQLLVKWKIKQFVLRLKNLLDWSQKCIMSREK